MRIRTFNRSALSLLLTVAVIAVGSISAFAAESKLAGEITVVGDQKAIVSVNGEAVKSGRTVFPASTIKTPANASAIINVKNVGKLRIAPKTEMVVSFDENGISGSIVSGKLTVVNSVGNVNITAPNGKIAALRTGESVITLPDDDDDSISSGNSWWLYALIFGGAGAAIAVAAASNNNRVDLGGGTTVVSPNI